MPALKEYKHLWEGEQEHHMRVLAVDCLVFNPFPND